MADLDISCRPNWNKAFVATSLYVLFLMEVNSLRKVSLRQELYRWRSKGKLPGLPHADLTSFFIESTRMNIFATRDITGQGMKIPSHSKRSTGRWVATS